MAFGDFVQGVTGDGTNPVFAGPVIAGNMLVAAVRIGATGATVSVADNINPGNWLLARSQVQTVDGHTGYVFYVPATLAGTPTVTITTSAGTKRLAVGEYATAGLSMSLDQVNSGQGTPAPVSSGNITTTARVELAIGAGTDDNAAVGGQPVWSSFAAWIFDIALVTGGIDRPVFLFHQVLASTQTISFAPTPSPNTATNLTSLITSFPGASPARVPSVHLPFMR